MRKSDALEFLPARFAEKIGDTTPGGCWQWTGAIHRTGYGVAHENHRKQWVAHRLVYTILVGNVPCGLQLDHVLERGCIRRDCVNPNHLEIVTGMENLLRGSGFPATNARKTHCVNGHALEGSNLKPSSNGWRVCRECGNAVSREYQRRKRAVCRLRT